MMWKLCGNAQFPRSRVLAIELKLNRNRRFPQNFHSRKLGEKRYLMRWQWLTDICIWSNFILQELHFLHFTYLISRYPQQNSKVIFLEVGKKYYLEGAFVESTGGDHMEIGVYLPDGSGLLPITSHYLSADAN